MHCRWVHNTPKFDCAYHDCRQYPYEQHEDGKYYSGYDDTVHEGDSYTGYSIWVNYISIYCRLSSLLNLSPVLGYISCRMGLVDPLCAREGTRDDSEHVTRLQGGAKFVPLKKFRSLSPLKNQIFDSRVVGYPCGRTSSVRTYSNMYTFTSDPSCSICSYLETNIMVAVDFIDLSTL